jgi:hypothetical protein
VYLHINIGCIKFREVDATEFRLRRRQGLYIPSSPFVTECLPPDGWDPCNDEYIQLLATGNDKEQDKAALTMDGMLIPRNKHIRHLIRIQPSGGDAQSPQARPASAKTNYIRLSDGIAPAPIWQRKNYGELPPKYPDRPISAPLGSNKARDLSSSRPDSASPNSLAARASSRRRPLSSPAKRTAGSRSSSRPASSPTKTPASPQASPSRALSRDRRPESAPPRADTHASVSINSTQNSPERQRGPAKMRPWSAAAHHGRPLSAKGTARQRPNSALAHSDASRSRPLSGARSRSPTRPRPHSAMSNIASSADEYDLIETID